MRVLLVVVAGLVLTGGVHASTPAAVQDHFPALSPDGQLIAFARFVGNGQRGRLIVMRRDGTHARALAPARNEPPRWSPDGSLVAYVDRDVYVVSPTGGRAHRLTHEYSSAGSPTGGIHGVRWVDARTIAYEVYDCCIVGGVEYWWEATVTLGGEQVDHASDAAIICNISVTCDGPRAPVTSADGSRAVTFTIGVDGVTRLTLAGSGLDPVDLGPGAAVVWAPGDAHFAWQVEDGSWTVADRDGQNGHALPAQWPNWSSDGARIAFTAKVEGHMQLWSSAGDGSDPKQLTHEPKGVSDSVTLGWIWSSHDRWLFYDVTVGQTLETVVLRPDGMSRHVLVRWHARFDKGAYSWDDSWVSLDWGPGDATAVYYDYAPCAGTAIYRVNVATAQVTRLTNPCTSRR
jgi:hypothetical protein